MTTFKKVDFVKTITTAPTAGNISIERFDLQPTIRTTFRSGYLTAVQYGRYRCKECTVFLKARSAKGFTSSSGNPVVGTGGIYFQPDIKINAPTTLVEILNSRFSVSKNITSSVHFSIPVDPSRVFTIRNGEFDTEDSDFRLSDFGYFLVFTEGCGANNIVAYELHISYEFEFFNYNDRATQIGGFLGCAYFSGTSTSDATRFGNVTVKYNNLGITMDSNKIFFPGSITTGRFMVQLFYQRDSSAEQTQWRSPAFFHTSSGGNVNTLITTQGYNLSPSIQDGAELLHDFGMWCVYDVNNPNGVQNFIQHLGYQAGTYNNVVRWHVVVTQINGIF